MTIAHVVRGRPMGAGVPRGPARLLVLRLVVEAVLALLVAAAALPLAALRGYTRMRRALWRARRAAIRLMGSPTHAASDWPRHRAAAAGIRRDPIHELELP